MPLYDGECEKCREVQTFFTCIIERNNAFCSCGGHLKLLISPGHKDWFRAHWNENFELKPIFVESKQHYRKLCKDYGMTARALM